MKIRLGCHGNIKIVNQWQEPIMELKQTYKTLSFSFNVELLFEMMLRLLRVKKTVTCKQ